MHYEVAFKAVEELIGGLAFDAQATGGGKCGFIGTFKVRKHVLAGLLLLQVRLSVEILRLYEAKAPGQRALQQNEVGGESLVLQDPDDASDFKVHALHLLKLFGTSRSPIHEGRVLRSILLAALVVLEFVLDH